MTQATSEKKVRALAEQVLFADESARLVASKEIYSLAASSGIRLASIAQLYQAIADGSLHKQFTAPAVNVRGLTLSFSAAIFRSAQKYDAGAFILELARSEMGYTNQPPPVFVPLILAGALIAGWTGPVFIQGDHYQVKAARSGVPAAGEIDAIKELIRSSLQAGMLNIDIDMSTLVDLDKSSVAQQQIPNVRYTKELVAYIRSLESGIEISIGGELGHIGGTNSTKEECEVFLSQVSGLRKLSIQTGTEHGGVVNPDGSLAAMKVDFDLHKELSQFVRSKFGLAGTVQHGASTLPDTAFASFPKSQAIEVHLATGLQNLLFDHPAFPADLTEKFVSWIQTNRSSGRKDNMSDKQFVYRERKRVWGPFQKEIWSLPSEVTEQLATVIEKRMGQFFSWFNLQGTRSLVNDLIQHQVFEPNFDNVHSSADTTASDDLAD